MSCLHCSYCFIHGTKSLKYTGGQLETVGPVAECLQRHGGDESQCVEHHPHYMWVPIFTLAQAAISYLPHYLWHYWEGEELYRDSLEETEIIFLH